MKKQFIFFPNRPFSRSILNKIAWSSIGFTMAITSCSQGQQPLQGQADSLFLPGDSAAVQVIQQDGTSTKKIKLAILLDTSGSMDGLIEQAKNQLWKIVNQLAKAKDKDGNDPTIEIALYHYGNDGNSVLDGYVQKISGFTSELDEISEQLFALRTNGGSEYCGTVIQKSIQELAWSSNPEDLQLIFIAGNEGFNQGTISYEAACGLAAQKNVFVNTIFCGDFNQGINMNWQSGAMITKGKYMNINSDAQVVHINSPYDAQINQLNVQLNNTYITYGRLAEVKKEKQVKQDENAESLGSANMAKRVLSKGGKAYYNYSWDLVDASTKTDFNFKDIKKENLPKEMQGLTETEQLKYIEAKKQERISIQKQIGELGKKRAEFVALEKAKLSGENQLDDAIIKAIVAQAKSKAYTFE